MGHTKGELQIKITIDEMYVYHWNNGEKFLIEAFHRPNTKEQAIINHLALCWNSHDALLEACEKTRERLIHICAVGGTLQDFIADGGLIEIVDTLMSVDTAKAAIAAAK